MSSPTARASFEDQHALRAKLNMQRELQIAEEEVFEEARRGSTTENEDGSQGSVGELVKPRRLAKVLDHIRYDKEDGKEALAAATREYREMRKENMGVKGLEGAQKVKVGSMDRHFKQAFYDC
ncbi:hypothetical protein N0V91_004083 [Didymella pomorum]|uniref:Uncharacterized protein n=1 Tax=Didymella pomorum TaxID=749634 RepID=A0A9W8ZF34_9PLEO|nr:hypothetical protein N0V91_004083 [Didymella pomorum]